MSGFGGALRRVAAGVGRWFRRRELVGTDDNGNKYFMWKENMGGGEFIEKRSMECPGGVYDPLKIPPEWSQWLHKNRARPPTPEEVAEKARMRLQIKARAAALEAHEAAMRFQAETTGEYSQPAGSQPNMGRFVEQLTGRGYAQAGEEATSREARADAKQGWTPQPGSTASGSGVPSKPQPAHGPSQPARRKGPSQPSAEADGTPMFEPDTWKPGGS